MTHSPFRSIVAALALLVAVAPSTARADEEADALAARGKALRYSVKTAAPASAIDTGGAAIFVNAPLSEVRKIVTNYGAYAKIIQPFKQSRVLSKKNGVSEVYLEVPVAHGAATVWAVAKMGKPVKDGDEEKIVAEYSRGNVDDFRAVWRLRAIDATHTIVKLEVLVDPKLPLPSSMVTPELKYAADKAVTAVRDESQKRAERAATAAARAGAAKSAVAKR
jgi:hypothetical protein